MKISIVGAAQIVWQYHIHALMAIHGVKIKSIIDLNYQNAERLASQCGAFASTNLHDVKGSNFVFIATPPHARVEIIRNLPADIRNIVIEKPVGFDISDLKELISISANRKIEINVAQTRRYFLNLKLASDLIGSGLLGRIKEVHLYEGAIFNWISKSQHLSDTGNIKDKGILQDVGSHLFDWLGTLLSKVGLSSEQFELMICNADYTVLSNNIDSEFNGPFKIKSKLSRSRLLANSIKIKGEKGTLITRSLLDDKIKIINDKGYYWIKTEHAVSDYSLETAFVEMWQNLLSGDRNTVNFPSLLSVKEGMIFIDKIIKSIDK